MKRTEHIGKAPEWQLEPEPQKLHWYHYVILLGLCAASLWIVGAWH